MMVCLQQDVERVKIDKQSSSWFKDPHKHYEVAFTVRPGHVARSIRARGNLTGGLDRYGYKQGKCKFTCVDKLTCCNQILR